MLALLIFATATSTLGLASSIFGITAIAGAVFRDARTRSALSAQGATIASQGATINALQVGLGESRTKHVECETNLALMKVAHATDVAKLTAKIEQVEQRQIGQFVEAVRQVVRTEMKGLK